MNERTRVNNPKKRASRKNPAPKKNLFKEIVETVVIITVSVFLIRSFVIQAFKIPTGSMEDTLLVGDFLLVNKFVYGAKVPFTDIRLPGYKDPQPGNIIVFKYPRDPELDYIKRLIAIEGQTIEIKDKQLYIDGQRFDNPTHSRFDSMLIESKGVYENGIFPPRSNFNKDNYGPIAVPNGHYFVMGDNRDNSLDSRYWGFLPKENLVGEALIIYWSWDPSVPLYNIISKVRWSRIANLIS